MGLIVLCSPDESRSLGAGSMGQAPLGPLDRGARTGAAGQAVAEVSRREAGRRRGDEVGVRGSLDLGRP